MKYRPPYTEIDMLNMLSHCRRNGLGIQDAMNFLTAKTPVRELWSLKEGEEHPDADQPCERCPYRPEDKADVPAAAPESADKATAAAASWDQVIDQMIAANR